MKVAVSIPDDTFAHAELLARRLNTSRSRLYARALDAFVQQHDGDSVTAQINAVLAEIDADPEAAEESKGLHEWSRAAARQVFARTDW